MKDDNKTKKQLIDELTELRSQKAALAKSVSAEKYRSLVENIRDVIYELDSQGVVLYISPAVRDMLGFASDEIVGKSFIELANKDDQSSMEEWFSELSRGGEYSSEYRVCDKSGELKWARTNTRPVMEDGQFKGVRGILIDVTAQRRSEEALRETNETLSTIVKSSPLAIIALDVDGNVIRWNPAAEEMFGWLESEALGHPLPYVPEDKRDEHLKLRERVLRGEGFTNVEASRRKKDGSYIDISISTAPLRDSQGRVTGVMSINANISERKQAEEALKESENKYRMIAENMTDVITIMDMNLRLTYVSPSIINMRGYTDKEVMKQSLEQIMTPESLQIIARVFEEEMQREASGTADPDRVRTLELEEYRKDMSTIWVEVSLSFLRDADGRPMGMLSLSRDISERKQAEEALRRSEEKYRWILDNMGDVITVMDMNLRFTYVSPSIISMRGYTAEEAMAQTLEQVMTPESLQIVAKVFEEEMRLEASGTTDPDRTRIVVMEQYKKDGSIVLMENHLSFMRDEAKKPVGIISVSHDITQRKRAEEELQQTLESLRKAIGTTIQVMVSAVEARDPYTAGHQIRSANLARCIATEMGLPQEKIDGIRMAGSIHDIGKLSVPAEILSKPTRLTELEFSLIKEHSRQGYEMLKDVESPWPLAEIVHQHHERMDGSGYPRNLKGEEILMEARILAVADVVESMASHRPYRPAIGIEPALEEIEKNKGILYDDAVADACLRLFREKGFRLE
jgi:PAS domain S-box-containing protein